jgi:hypothetical protein
MKLQLAVIFALTAILATPADLTRAGSSSAVKLAVGSETHVAWVSQTDMSSTTKIEPLRWVGQWQMWDWTQYRSHASCMSRGRQILRAFPDVEQITCRKPPRCNYWNLFTFRKQWV